MEKITITIKATATGVETVLSVDGKQIARQNEVPSEYGCKCKEADWQEQLGVDDPEDESDDGLNDLAEFMDEKFSFFGLDLLNILHKNP